MVQINFALKEINCKLVYYGPGRSGKTTNLEQVHQKAPDDSKGELVSINTETDRTLYFDFLPLNLGKVAGMTTKFQLYTVPGQVYYNATRKLVLQGVDGVVFVADSSPHMMDENIESLENMLQNLTDNGIDVQTIPIVLQLNKRDIDGALDINLMVEKLNRHNWPIVEACAFKGEGVFPTLKKLAGLVIAKLNDQEGQAKSTSVPTPVAPPPVQAKTEIAPVAEAVKEPIVSPKIAEAPIATSVEKKPVVASVPPPPKVSAPVVETPSEPKKDDSKADLIAARLAKMRAEKGIDTSPHVHHENVEENKPKKLPSKGLIGFIKRLFGK